VQELIKKDGSTRLLLRVYTDLLPFSLSWRRLLTFTRIIIHLINLCIRIRNRRDVILFRLKFIYFYDSLRENLVMHIRVIFHSASREY